MLKAQTIKDALPASLANFFGVAQTATVPYHPIPQPTTVAEKNAHPAASAEPAVIPAEPPKEKLAVAVSVTGSYVPPQTYAQYKHGYGNYLWAVLYTLAPESFISFLTYMGRFFNSLSETAQKALSMFKELSKNMTDGLSGGLSGLVGLGTFISMYKLYGDAIGDFGNRLNNALVAWASSIKYLFHQGKLLSGAKELFITPLSFGIWKSNTRTLMNDFVELEELATKNKLGPRARTDFILEESARRLAHRYHHSGKLKGSHIDNEHVQKKKEERESDLDELVHHFQTHFVEELPYLQVDALLAAFAKSDQKDQLAALEANTDSTISKRPTLFVAKSYDKKNDSLILKPAKRDMSPAEKAALEAKGISFHELTLEDILSAYGNAALDAKTGRYCAAKLSTTFENEETEYTKWYTMPAVQKDGENALELIAQSKEQRLAHAEHGRELIDLIFNKADRVRRYDSYQDEAFVDKTIASVNEHLGEGVDVQGKRTSVSGSIHEQLKNAQAQGIRQNVLRKIIKGERGKVLEHLTGIRRLLENSLDRELYTAFKQYPDDLQADTLEDLRRRREDVCSSWLRNLQALFNGKELDAADSPEGKRLQANFDKLIANLRAKGFFADGEINSSVLHPTDRQKLLVYIRDMIIPRIKDTKEKAWKKLHERTHAWLYIEKRKYWFQKFMSLMNHKVTGSQLDLSNNTSKDFKRRQTAIQKVYEQLFDLNLPQLDDKFRPYKAWKKPDLQTQTQIWQDNKEKENPNWLSTIGWLLGNISGTLSALANGALGAFGAWMILHMPSILALGLSTTMQFSIMGVMFSCGFAASVLLTRNSVKNSFMDFGTLLKEGSKNIDLNRKKRTAWTFVLMVAAVLAGLSAAAFAYAATQTVCDQFLIEVLHWSLSPEAATAISAIFGVTTGIAAASLMGRIAHAEGLYLGRVVKGKEQLGWNKLSTSQKGLSVFAGILAVALGIGTGFTGIFGALKVIPTLAFISSSAVPVVNVIMVVAAVVYGLLTLAMVARPLQEKLVHGDGNWKNYTTAQKGIYFTTMLTGAAYRFGPMLALFVLPLAFSIPVTWPIMLGIAGVAVATMVATKLLESHFLKVPADPTPEDSVMLSSDADSSEFDGENDLYPSAPGVGSKRKSLPKVPLPEAAQVPAPAPSAPSAASNPFAPLNMPPAVSNSASTAAGAGVGAAFPGAPAFGRSAAAAHVAPDLGVLALGGAAPSTSSATFSGVPEPNPTGLPDPLVPVVAASSPSVPLPLGSAQAAAAVGLHQASVPVVAPVPTSPRPASLIDYNDYGRPGS